MHKEERPLVSIICLTYNHAPYIRECLDGFLMQKTDFTIEIIIHDDASTDGTTEIVREYERCYQNIIVPIYQKENQYSTHHNFSRIIHECLIKCKGKYIALCEGDDYWIDPLKLQKQVNFLESHCDFGMCFTKVKRYNDSTKKYIDEFGRKKDTLFSLFHGNTIPTPTVILSRNLYENYYSTIKPEKQHWLMGDYPLWLWVAGTSKIHFIDEVTAIYRILDNSASHFRQADKCIAFEQSYYNIKLFFYNIFQIKSKKIKNIIEMNHIITNYNICIEYNLPFDKILKMLDKIEYNNLRLKLIKYSCNHPIQGRYINKAFNLTLSSTLRLISKLKSKCSKVQFKRNQS